MYRLSFTLKNNMLTITKKNGQIYHMRENLHRIFTPDEWNKFYNTLRENQKPVFDCLINTGARISEMLGIRKKDISFEKKILTLINIKKRTFFSDGKVRNIKISSQYCERLKIYCEKFSNDDLIFSKGNIRFDKVRIAQLFRRKLKGCIKDYREFSLHNIRKTTECWLNYLNNNYLMLLKHMGHNQSTALKFYLNTDVYDSNYKFKARQILGDLYM